jgi:hypothetical protein
MSAFTRGTRSGGSALHCMAEGSGGPRQVPARGKIHLQPQNLQVRRTITAPPASPLSRSFGAPSYQPNMAHRLCQGESARVEDLDAALRRPVVLACMVGTICCGGNDHTAVWSDRHPGRGRGSGSCRGARCRSCGTVPPEKVRVEKAAGWIFPRWRQSAELGMSVRAGNSCRGHGRSVERRLVNVCQERPGRCGVYGSVYGGTARSRPRWRRTAPTP